jgi:arsenic resistance protein ArsH
MQDRLFDDANELVRFTLLLRDRSNYLTNRYSERVAAANSSASSMR